jgi:phage-related tail fiber protein
VNENNIGTTRVDAFSIVADVAGTVVPAGTIIAFAGSTPPPGWFVCDGSEVSRSQYRSLFGAIGTSWGGGDGASTFKLPDLRGRFMRGVDSGAGRDPQAASRAASASGGAAGDAVGSVQGGATARPGTPFWTDATGQHAHNGSWLGMGWGAGSFNAGLGRADGNSPANLWGMTIAADGLHSHTIATGGDPETRPVNANVNFIIKY